VKVLAGDIGGTKTTLAIFEVDGKQLETLAEETYPSAQHDSLDEIVREFVAAQKQKCEWASFGIAGPIKNGQVKTTNLPWLIDAKKLADEVGFRQVWLLNDLQANAWGISVLEEKDFFVLNEGIADANGNASIISAGTGLGQAGLYWNGEQMRPFASEGGHTDFSPSSELELELLKFLQKDLDHVSWERVVSGMGIGNIYDFLCDYRKSPTPAWLEEDIKDDKAKAVAKAAQDERCPICTETLDLFVYLYGVEAGNHALKIMATGGVYLGGGIAPKNLDRLRAGGFMKGFCAKGRMQQLMMDMPVKVILNQRTALLGPAVFAAAEIK
jgi:glucokinase